MEEAETLLTAARTAHVRGDVSRAKELHLRIISLYPRTPEAEEAIQYLTTERAAPQRVLDPGVHSDDDSLSASRGSNRR